MTTNTQDERRSGPRVSEVVLEVPREDELTYGRHSYHDLVHVWNELVSELTAARETGDADAEVRLHDELQHFWPHADEVADVPWVPDEEREQALPPADG